MGGLFAFATVVRDSPPPTLEEAPPAAAALVASLLTVERDTRPSAAALLDRDPFVQRYGWAAEMGDYWASALRAPPLDGGAILEAISTAVGFAAVRDRRRPELGRRAPTEPEPESPSLFATASSRDDAGS